MKFWSRGLLHTILRVWTAEGEVLQHTTLSVSYLRSLSTLNVKCVCGEQALWMKGWGDPMFETEGPLTCLGCVVSP